MNAVLGKKFTEFCISFYKLFTMLILKRDLISLEFRVSSVNIFLHLGFISTESFFFQCLHLFLQIFLIVTVYHQTPVVILIFA